MGIEKRRNERLGARLFAYIREEGAEKPRGRGVILDVSLGGFGLECEADLDAGSIYEFDVEIPMTLKAKIVRMKSPGQMKQYGVQIVQQGFFDKLLLKRLLKGRRTTTKI